MDTTPAGSRAGQHWSAAHHVYGTLSYNSAKHLCDIVATISEGKKSRSFPGMSIFKVYEN